MLSICEKFEFKVRNLLGATRKLNFFKQAFLWVSYLIVNSKVLKHCSKVISADHHAAWSRMRSLHVTTTIIVNTNSRPITISVFKRYIHNIMFSIWPNFLLIIVFLVHKSFLTLYVKR